jgi:hypothetical protein
VFYRPRTWGDIQFANQLYNDLNDVGVRCWLDTKELLDGDSIQDRIESRIRGSDRMLAILSVEAIKSPWLKKEIEVAIDLEEARGETVVFPIRLDNIVLDGADSTWAKISERQFADFTDWRKPQDYRRAFSHLARVLALSAATEGEIL